MSTIADVDVQVVAMDGVTFRMHRDPDRARISVICASRPGATALWMTDLDALPDYLRVLSSLADVGGVEVHSASDDGELYGPADCEYTATGRCWSGGVSLVGLQFPELIKAGDSAAVLRLLAERHQRAFGGAG